MEEVEERWSAELEKDMLILVPRFIDECTPRPGCSADKHPPRHTVGQILVVAASDIRTMLTSNYDFELITSSAAYNLDEA